MEEKGKQYRLITEMIDEVTLNQPNASAVSELDNDFDYQTLAGFSNVYANSFIERKIKKYDVVAIVGHSGFLQIAAIIGAWKIGAVILAIDPTLPDERMRQLIEDANVKLLASDGESNLAKIIANKTQYSFLNLQAINVNDTKPPPYIKLKPEDPAYIVVTSGSTGKPKGILGSHKGLSHFISWQIKEFDIQSTDRCAQLTSVAFDVVFRSIFTPLCSGAAAVIPPIQNLSAATVLPWMEEQNITMVHLVPSLAKLWLAEDLKYSLPSLRYVFFAGEKLHSSLLERWREVIASPTEFINLYGPSETTLAKCYYRIPNNDYQGVYPVGMALPETEVRIMKDKTTDCKPGETGEIVIKTSFCSLGYLEAPPDSGFSKDAFFTGDLGFYNKNNGLEILGRKDHQIKYNGVRIEVEEIEVSLNAYKKVTASCVAVKKYKDTEYLTAFLQTSTAINIDDIRAYLKTKLPQNMLPNLYVRVEKLPYTKSGKLDRKKLPEIEDNTEIMRNNSVSPEISSDTERRLLAIWSKILNFDNISLNENFFTIGGNSLQAMRILARIGDEFGVYIPQATIMQHPTIIEQAKYIESRLDSKNHILKKLNDQNTVSKEFPLSINQEEYWYYYSNKPTSPVYNVYKIFKIDGALNHDALEQSLIELVKKHRLLGTRFLKAENGSIKQAYVEPKDNILEYIDIESEKSLKSEIRKRIKKPFDLLHEHAFKFTLLSTNNKQFLLLNFHHIVVDGWSSSLILETIGKFYNQFTSRNKIENPNFEISYQHYVAWQDEWITSKECCNMLQFWENELKDTNPTEIPPDLNIKRTFSYEGNELTAKINKADVEKYCKSHNITTYLFFYTTLSVFLSRYTQNSQVTIGTPVTNRDNPQTENIVGPLVNTLVFKLDVSPEQSYEDHLDRAKKKLIENLQHQETPFTTVYSHLLKKKLIKPSQRIFSIFFYMEDEPKLLLKDAKSESLSEINGTSKFDIAIRITTTTNDFKISIEYDINLYRQETIQLILNRFKRLIKQVQVTLSTPIKDLTLDDANEPNSVSTLKGKSINLKKTALAEIFDEKNYTNQIAIEDHENSVNYADFFDTVESVSHFIKTLNEFKAQMPIAVCMDRSKDAVVAMMAILKSGGIYVPVNMQAPLDRIKKIIEKSSPALIITDSDHQNTAKDLSENIININSIEQNIPFKQHDTCFINQPAYIVFTSGTTGEPKAILQTHRMLTNLTKWQSTKITNKHHRVAMFSSFGFDVSIQEIFYCLYTNSTLCIIPEEAKKDARELWRYLTDNKVEILFAPPQALYMLCCIDDWKNEDCSLKYILVAGEALKIGNNERNFFSKFNTIQLINQYGPSETHVVTSYEMPNDRMIWQDTPPIGQPLPNTEIIIVDAQGHIQPKDTIGELYVAGANLADGYYENKEQTDAKFIKNPDTKSKYQIAYKTGDLAKITADNEIIYFGRADRQIKILCYRVELSDIEINLSDNSNVKMCAVTLKNVSDRDVLTAYIVPHSDDYNIENYKIFLNERLPNYMIPQFYIHLNTLPVTENGKVDIRALPAPKAQLAAKKSASTKLQKTLANIWGDILKINPKNIDINANFFELGGTSLLTVKMLVNVERALKINLKTKIVYENPTISQLASYIEKDEHDRFDLLPIYNAPQSNSYPLTDQQTAWWILNKMSPTSSNNVQFTISLGQDISPDQLETALNQLADENFVLRMSIDEEDGMPKQKLAESVKPHITLIDLNTNDQKHCAEIITKKIEEDISNPLHLDSAPLYRAIIFKHRTTNTTLYFCFHHIIFDEWSMELFKERLLSALDGQESVIKYDYQDYAFTQKKWKTKSLLDSRKTFWRNMIESSAQDVHINYDKHSKIKYGPAKRVYLTIDDSEVATYYTKNLMKKNITTFDATLSLYRLLIYFFTTRTNCLIGIPFLNRKNPELSEILGLFANTVPVNIPINTDASYIELCDQTKKIIYQVRDNIEYTFDPEDQLEIFNFMFVYKDATQKDDLNALYGKGKNTQFDLNLITIKKEKSIEFIFEYNSDFYLESTIKRIADVFHHLITEIPKNQLRSISQYQIISSEEKERIINDFCHAPTFSPPFDNAFDIFEKAATKNPDRICLQLHENKLTYQSVLNKAEQIAETVFGKKKMIGIFLQRGTDMIIAILACLRAGIPYVPLDPNYPEQQLKYIYNQSDIDCILTNTKTLKSTQTDLILNDLNLINLDEIEYSNEKINLPKPTSNDLSYVIYTSGSTGKPKGVMLTHENLVNTICATTLFFKFPKNSNFSQFFSINFDASLFDTFVCFANESTLFIIDDATRKQPDSLIEFYLKNKINITFLTPALLSILPQTKLPDLKAILIGGDVVDQSAAEYWSTQAKLYNAYGPTETAISSSIHKYKKGDNIRNIGKPLNNFVYYILNGNLQMLPGGVIGELYIGGPSVAKGYLGREDLTEERFLSIPHIDDRFRLYKTGDLAYWDSQGDIIFIGRNDSQIKFRGFRIELGNIEAALSQLSYVNQCVVLLTDYSGIRHLTAYYTINDSTKNEIDIKNDLRKGIPDYMIPTQYIQLDYLPITPNGKIDKRNLPKPDLQSSLEKIAPSTQLEKEIAHIWAKVLGVSVESVGLTDNFYDLGGQSLTLARMVTELSAQHDISVNYSSFMSSPTIQFIIQQSSTNNDIVQTERKDVKQALSDIQIEFKKNTSSKKPNFENPSDILLTGATGFVGQYLLQELLDKTDARIHCLSRNPEKITIKSPRIIHYVSDLAKPKLNLRDEDYKNLADNIDLIYHCGAYVNHILGYRVLRDANVFGTKSLLDLITMGKPKCFFYISTISCAMIEDENGRIAETWPSSGPPTKSDGYAMSKWAGECLVKKAKEANYDCSILRLGNVTGDTKTGYSMIEVNHIYLFLKGCLQMGYAPEMNTFVEMTPVDILAKAIYALSMNKEAHQNVLQLNNPALISWDNLLRNFTKANNNIELLPFSEWKKNYLKKIDESNALYRLKAFYMEDIKFSHQPYETTKAQRLLTESGVEYPQDYMDLLKLYDEFSTKINFF